MFGDPAKAQESWQKVQQQELYKNWSEKYAAIQEVKRFASIPQKSVKTQDDESLINAVTQVAMPSTSMRGSPDMAAKAQREAQPIMEVVGEAWKELTKQQILTAGTRQRLLAMGQRRAQYLEQGAASVIKSQAPLTHRATFVPPQQFLNSAEMELYSGGGTTPPGASGSYKTTTLPSGRQVAVPVNPS